MSDGEVCRSHRRQEPSLHADVPSLSFMANTMRCMRTAITGAYLKR